MEQQNFTSTVTEIVLLGLTQNHELQYFLFGVFFIIYMATCLGNFTIIIMVILSHQLHTPMYFLLANLAFLDVTDSSINTPTLLSGLLSQHKIISFHECILQIFFFHFIGAATGLVLVIMAIDRYVAIYKPLQYLTIMNWDMCTGLMAGSWLGGMTHSLVQIALLLQLPFCGPNVLENFYCDIPQVIKLACADTYIMELLMVSNSGLLLIIIFIILLISYTVLLFKISRHVTEGKRKALSTCGAQITVVNLIFIPSILIYAWPFTKFPLDQLAAVIYTVITPMLNPVIYALRNAEMKKAVKRLIIRMLSSGRIQNHRV